MARRGSAWCVTLSACVVVVAGCVRGGPPRTSDAGGGSIDAEVLDAGSLPGDAGEPLDAPMTGPEDAGTTPPPTDAGFDAGTSPEVDAHVPPPVDGGPPPGTRGYLDRCTSAAECVSGLCAIDRGGTRFCSRICTSHRDCADEHVCVGGTCVPDDSGEPCSPLDPSTCSTMFCLGPPSGGQCVRECEYAAECPAGHACTTVPGDTVPGRRVCVDIEKPCTDEGSECGTSLCVSGLGCTALCRTAADCPPRLGGIGLPPYRCELAYGSTERVCVTPEDVEGTGPIGTLCVDYSACRSGACDDGARPEPMCTQACTSEGGCAVGLGCFPTPTTPSGPPFVLACQRAGTRDLGEACASARDCHSSLCDTAGYCTRLCNDGLCPTGWACQPVPGVPGVAICRR